MPYVYCAYSAIFIYFDKQSPDLVRDTCLAPKEFKRSISSPRPKKVVHQCGTPSKCFEKLTPPYSYLIVM